MLAIQNLGYTHPDKSVLFDGLNLTVNRHQQVALVGNNGTGKTTLLKIAAGLLPPTSGQVLASAPPYYVPQHVGQLEGLTVAQALGIADKLAALRQILAGQATDAALAVLNDDWTIEEKAREALHYWGLAELAPELRLADLSGGQKTRLLLAGLAIHQPEVVLLDEPSNHLDVGGRQQLYTFLEATQSTLLVVSHDRQLLDRLGMVAELSKRGLALYGGNYTFYAAQKQAADTALLQEVKGQEKALRKARETEREVLERKQKQDARSAKNQAKSGLPTIVLGMRQNSAENSGARLRQLHAGRTTAIAHKLHELRQELPALDKMKLGFAPSGRPKGKALVTATAVNYCYGPRPLWQPALSFQVRSGERLAIQGPNGTGKTTLLRLLTGELAPPAGTLHRADLQAVYLDQEYSLLHDQLTVYKQAQRFNAAALPEHEVKIRLSRFLFAPDDWGKLCGVLSGGERMRLLLCCLTLRRQAPDLILLDEPTNNLDMQNLAILAAALSDYEGALVVVSHDAYFLEQLRVERTIQLA